MKCATKLRRGFTLVELLLALAISGLVAAGVAGMLGGVATGIAVGTDARTGMLATGVIQGRVVESVTPGASVLAAEPQRCAIWLGDTRPGGLVEPSECAWLTIDQDKGIVTWEHVVFPESWGPVERARADQPLRPNGDPFPVLEETRALGIIETEILADGLLDGEIPQSNQLPGSREVRINLRLDLPTGPWPMSAIAVFQNHQMPPEWNP